MNKAESNAMPERRPGDAGRFIDVDARSSGSRSHGASIDARSMLGRLPAGDEFIALLKAFRPSGGTAPVSLFAPLYAQHQFEGAPSVQTLIEGGDLFGFQWRAASWIPLFQFDADRLTIKAVAQEIRRGLPPAWSGWDLAAWFAQPNALLEDRRPVDLLDACAADVLAAARSHRLGRAAKPTERVMRFS